MNAEYDSLNRFVETRGSFLLGAAVGQVNYKVQTVVGGALIALSTAFCIAPMFGAPPEIMFGTVGPLTGGVINLAMARAMRRRTVPNQPDAVRLTPPAKQLLMTLYREQFGWWSSPGIVHGPARRRQVRRMRRLSDELTLNDAVLPYLERAAEAYQRIAAVMSTGSLNGSLTKLGGRAWGAADETMADMLHQCGVLCQFPESLDTAAPQLEQRITTMREIADRMESLRQTESPSVASGAVADVLTDLRLEQLARSEVLPVVEPRVTEDA